ncbi:Gfo/Idh/MocA family oxidoreductase [candidate division KSB1 bacterium]|nr:Gfo/Idh/MocA family oxidoreductase [candidate division KSB1 bacterium]
MKPVNFGLVGFGGYAKVYYDMITEFVENKKARLVAVAEWQPEKFTDQISKLKQAGVKIFKDYDELLAECEKELDIVALPVGIHLHVPFTIKALKRRIHVICEKPVAATIQDVDYLIQEREKSGKKVFIGFQEILSPSIRQIKDRMVAGNLGQIHTIKLKGGWPRPNSYYTRNAWAGKLRSGTNWILDGPAHNAMAHYLNNMFYVASSDPAQSARPISIQAELYRAWPIETYDTVCLKSKLNTGANLFFFASHCSETEFHPEMSIIAEKATIIRKFENGATSIHYHDGRKEQFDDGTVNPRREVFASAIKNLQGQIEHHCSLEIARSQTLCVNGMHESCPQIFEIPVSGILEREIPLTVNSSEVDHLKVIKGIDKLIHQAYQSEKLFSEVKIQWAQPTKPFNLEGYNSFPSDNFNIQ